MLSRKLLWTLSVAATCSMVSGAARATVDIALVPVGNVGNAADPATGNPGFGQVNYAYSIGKYDVTVGQYTQFLNAVAKTDTYGLYNANMGSGDLTYGCGIAQTGSPGSYTYSVTKNANYPVNYVTFWDACRFTNWLQNGQPTGGENANTTETGAYDLTNPTAITNNTVTRTAGATWAVASENEWYKAAYYNPATGSYYRYPTSSNTAPGNSLALASMTPNEANYYITGYTDPINYLTPVGTFAASPSPYGTFDQGGNVWQWNDTYLGGLYRALRGGSFNYGDSYLASGDRGFNNPLAANMVGGFRVSQVPEPASMALLGLGLAATVLRGRRAKRRQPRPDYDGDA